MGLSCIISEIIGDFSRRTLTLIACQCAQHAIIIPILAVCPSNAGAMLKQLHITIKLFLTV